LPGPSRRGALSADPMPPFGRFIPPFRLVSLKYHWPRAQPTAIAVLVVFSPLSQTFPKIAVIIVRYAVHGLLDAHPSTRP
jgi:hypothetical protein